MSSGQGDSLGLWLYRLVTAASGPVAGLLLRRRLVQGKEDPARIAERRGFASRPRPAGPLVWIHCASVGESLSVLSLIDQMTDARRDLHFLVTTGTLTSARLMAERLPENAIHQFVPLDHPDYCTRFLDHWRPDLGLIIESELWPNLILGAAERGITLVLANARLSADSFKGWRRAQKSIARLLGSFDQVLAQDDQSAARLRTLGAPSVSVPGNLKFDAPPLPADARDLERLSALIGDRPRWVAASTHEGEERLTGNIHLRAKSRIPGLLTVIVPRHPARGREIAADLRGMGLNVCQRSLNEPLTAATEIYLADTLGETGLFYRLSPIAFIGGSLVEVGGHNPLEAVRLDTAVLFGPHMFNFDLPAASLLECGAAAQVTSEETLRETLLDWLADAPAVARRAALGKDLADKTTGVAERVCNILLPLLPPPVGPKGDA